MFSIAGTLPGLNEIIDLARRNRFMAAKQKKKETARCQWAILAGSVPEFSVPVEICFTWHEPSYRRDPDNVCAGAKFILDALVKLRKIPEDSRRWVKEIRHVFPDPDRAHPRIEVELTSLESKEAL